MTVYLDILFFINFLMNFFVISICTAIAPGGSKAVRKILASVLGGIYGVGIFIPELDFLYSVLAVFLFSAGLVAIIFCPCKISEFFKILLVFYISSFMLSGGIYMMLPLFGGGIIKNNIIYTNSINLIFFGVVVGILVLLGIKNIRKNFLKRNIRVMIRYKDRTVESFGLIDTGNGLKDPKSGEGVIVIDKSVLEKLFFKGCNELNLGEWIDSEDLRLIPYKTVANEGVMTGFLADEVMLGNKRLKNVTVAISPEILSQKVLANCENF